MNFNLSEEQSMIRDSVARFVQDNYELKKRNATVTLDHGFSVDNWRQFAELGWLSVPFSEEYGGFGGGPVDTMVVMQELGRGLVAEPYLPTVLLFGGLLQAGASEAVKSHLIPKIIAGELQGAFAYLERQSRYEITDIGTRARQERSKWVLNGEKSIVLNGDAAQKIIVLARTSGDQVAPSGLSLFLVDAQAEGLEKVAYRMTDGREAANIRFDDVSAEALIGTLGDGYSLVTPVVEQAMLAISADALGAMEFLYTQTVEYLKTRKQFGTHIGSFQALQHRAVDMFAACENSKSLLYRAVCSAAAGDADAGKNLVALKVMIGRAGRHIGAEAIQMHGGMGMTDELSVGFYVKRLMIANTLFGDADYHQQRFSALTNGAAVSATSTAAA